MLTHPKGDGGLNSRACLRILSLGVEYLKVLNSRAPKGDGGQSSLLTHPLPLGRAPKGPYGRAPKGPYIESDGGLISSSRSSWVYLLAPPKEVKKRVEQLKFQFTYWALK